MTMSENSCHSTGDNSLLEFLDCEALDLNLYRGQSKDFEYGQVFGGQVLGQAIKAAYSTVQDGRFIHSAHVYFLTRGDVNTPIIYEVDRSLDGGSFSSRRVVAIQHGKQIFHLSASFQKAEQGLEYSEKVELPIETLNSSLENQKIGFDSHQEEFVEMHYLSKEQVTKPNSVQFWFKTKNTLPDNLPCHHSVLAYISDMGLLESSLVPHSLNQLELSERKKKLIIASLDHAIWFHRPFRADQWMFYDCEVQSTSNARGLSFGHIYTQDGTLVATTTQEGLIRLRR